MVSFQPVPSLSDDEIRVGKQKTIRDGVTTQVMVTATEGVFLISFALLLGATNTMIGIIAAIPFLSQLGQVLGIYLLEKYRLRKKIVVVAVFISRVFLLLVALIPFLGSASLGLMLLIIFMIFRNLTGSIAGVAWNSWMRDLIPSSERGSFFANRMRIATIVGTILLVVFSILIDTWANTYPENEILGYTYLFIFGFIGGMLGLFFLSTTPEPQMPSFATKPLREVFKLPFRDTEFRPLLVFLFIWNFAINLAAPFFTVYMLSQLKLPLAHITLFLVLTQVVNILFLQLWGRFSDRFSYKSILVIAAPLFILTFPIWTLTTNPGIYILTYPLLIMIHIILGITMSGINLAIGTIAMKLSPAEAASSYLATAGMVNSLAAGVGTILGGLLADFFNDKTLTISIEWISSTATTQVPALNLQKWDFVFVIAFLLGLVAVERLTAVRESGTIPRKEALSEFFNEVRAETRRYSPVAGLTRISQIPIVMREKRTERKVKRKQAQSGMEGSHQK